MGSVLYKSEKLDSLNAVIFFILRIVFSRCISVINSRVFGLFILQKMDKNKDGVVTLDEFIESCQEVSLDFLPQ